MGRSVSFVKGRGSLAHNNREFSTKNVDKERTAMNVVYVQEPLDEAYRKLFGEALDKYNEKQTRKDRQIPDYIEHIRTSKNGEKVFYENVVQVGTMHDTHVLSADGKVATAILDEYMRGFQARNPNLYVFNAVLHLDEKTPHLHIDYIPVAHGYSRGLETRNSLDRALKEQGITGEESRKGNSTQNWQKRERECVIGIMERHGFEYEAAMDTDRGNLSVNQYKAMAEEVESRVQAIPDKVESKPIPFSKDRVSVATEDLAALEEKAKLQEVKETVGKSLSTYIDEQREAADRYIEAYKESATKEISALKAGTQDAFLQADSLVREAQQLRLQAQREREQVISTKKKYDALYAEQAGLRTAYDSVVKENAELKTENASLKAQISSLKNEIATKVQEAVAPLKRQMRELGGLLLDVYKHLTSVIKATGMLLYDRNQGYAIENPTPKQQRLIDGIAEVSEMYARALKFDDLAEQMKTKVGLDPELKSVIEPQEKKPRTKGPER